MTQERATPEFRPPEAGSEPDTRRIFLKRAGGVFLLAAGGLAWRAYDTGVFSVGRGPAYEPWRTWRGGGPSEGPLALVRAGVLAASVHNSQPWLFRVGSDSLELLADPGRHLGPMDPFRREQHISLGCALENMVLAAGAQGLRPEVEFLPGRLIEPWVEVPSVPAPEVVARLRFTPSRRDISGLYAVISQRHTNRGPYFPDRGVPRETLWAFNDLAREDDTLRLVLLEDGVRRAVFDRLMVDATEAIVADREMIEASNAWFRLTPREIDEHRDGPTIDSFGLPPLSLAAVKMLPKPEPEKTHRQWVTATRDVQLATAPLVGLIAVRDPYERATALRAGLFWQRLQLWATAQGLAMQPMNQFVQVIDRDRQLKRDSAFGARLAEVLGDDRWRATLAFRAGYPAVAAGPSPRRSIEGLVLEEAPAASLREADLIAEQSGFSTGSPADPSVARDGKRSR
ncbi:MAG: hypothetical protein QNJ30_03140 [Kiloniellales bacterium]|nr:hypothetical protein [Kiloniellales bacterium]